MKPYENHRKPVKDFDGNNRVAAAIPTCTENANSGQTSSYNVCNDIFEFCLHF